jgi:hypothetical protein
MSVRHVSRTLGGLVAAFALLAVTAGPALAHECFVANRSDQGNAAVGAHSSAWQTVSLYTIVTEFLGQSPEVADCVVAAAPDAGVPTTFVFGGKQAQGSGGVIMENNPNDRLMSDGRGIDHAEDVYGEAVVGLIFACGGGF